MNRWNRAIALLNDGPWGKSTGKSGGKGGSDGGGDSGGGGGSGGSGGGDDGKGPRNPWDFPPKGPRRPKGPSALDQLLDQAKGRLGGGGPGGSSGGGGGGFSLPGGADFRMGRNIGLGILALWLLFTSFHTIGAQEEGVVTRLGKYQAKLPAGIGLTLPSPIDKVRKVDIQGIQSIDIPDGGAANFILTGDQNIIDLAYAVRWSVKDSHLYLFQFADPQNTIREVGESVMREVLSTVTLNDAMGPKRSMIEQLVAARMQSILDSKDYRAGVQIRGIAIKQADPPKEVNDAFKAVTVAQQNRQANINNANAYAQQIMSRAQGEATAFDKVYEQYRLSPDVTRRRMYYETMEEILSRTNKTIVEPNGVTPYLPIGSKPRPQVSVEEGTK